MANLEQQRAQLAYDHVSQVKDCPEADRKKYATLVHKLPALISSAGLCQALHFVETRPESQRVLLEHLGRQLMRIDPNIRTTELLLKAVRTAELTTYLRLTREAAACASWYRRMVQGVLKLEAGDCNDET